jgi:hypothetical protein
VFRTTGRMAAVAGVAVALALTTPTLANAQGAHPTRVGINNLSGASAIHAPSAHLGKVVPQAASAFPSASSTIIGSTGFIDAEQVGYFWSAARGDSVEQSFSGPASVNKAKLKLDVTYNGLVASAETDWTLSINGTDVGSFVIPSGQLGPVTASYKFKKIKGGTYDVKIRETNEVAPGEGAIALRYAGTGPHSIKLK